MGSVLGICLLPSSAAWDMRGMGRKKGLALSVSLQVTRTDKAGLGSSVKPLPDTWLTMIRNMHGTIFALKARLTRMSPGQRHRFA